MKLNCPSCQSNQFVKDGHYFRQNDSRFVQRFKCKLCPKKFARSTFELEYRHKKRRVNFPLFKLLSSGVSMRRSAWILGINRKTVERKFVYLANKARQVQSENLEKGTGQTTHVQFDDLVTIEHTKLKPLSVTAAIDVQNRIILGVEVSQIPAFGHLAKLSRAKYGPRPCKHRDGLRRLFKKLKPIVHPKARFESDEHKAYPPILKEYFPQAEYKQYKGGRGCVTGQGELKKQHFDPLFGINHTYAMLRYCINRLIRRSWCTTKRPQRLKDHLDIYLCFHNGWFTNSSLSPP